MIIFPAPAEPTDQPYEDIVSLVGYLSQIPEEKAKKIGFTIVVDARKGSIRAIRNVLRACQVSAEEPERELYVNIMNEYKLV